MHFSSRSPAIAGHSQQIDSQVTKEMYAIYHALFCAQQLMTAAVRRPRRQHEIEPLPAYYFL